MAQTRPKGDPSGARRQTKCLAGKGARVFLTDIQAQALDAVARELRSAGNVCLCHAADISD